jgi:integrase
MINRKETEMRGFVRQRSEGSAFTAYWESRDPATGQRRQHSKGGFPTKKAATAHLNQVVGKVQAGEWRPDKALTVSTLLVEHWLPAQKARELRPATIAQYEGVVENWIVPRLGGTKVASLTPATVVKFMTELRSETSAHGRAGLSARSTQLSVGILKAACAWALGAELVGRNPIASVSRPRAQAPAMKVWTEDQARTFLAFTSEDRLSVAWSLLLGRGLRRGELCGLRWSSVDLEAGALRIDATLIVADGHTTESRPKTDAGRRRIPLDARLVALLRSHRARQAAEKLAAGDACKDGGYIIADELGRPYYPGTISVAFKAQAKAAGLPVIRLHDTRHTAASLMLADGVPTKVVTEILGHASPVITLSTYAHVLPGMAEQAGAALSARLFG